MIRKLKINWLLGLFFYLLTLNVILASIDKSKCSLILKNNNGEATNVCLINQNVDLKDFDFKTVCQVYSASLDKNILIVESDDDIGILTDEETIYLCDSEGTRCVEKVLKNSAVAAGSAVLGTSVTEKAASTATNTEAAMATAANTAKKKIPLLMATAAGVAAASAAVGTITTDDDCTKVIDKLTDKVLGDPLEKAEKAAAKKEKERKEEEAERSAERKREEMEGRIESAERKREAAQEARERRNQPKD